MIKKINRNRLQTVDSAMLSTISILDGDGRIQKLSDICTVGDEVYVGAGEVGVNPRLMVSSGWGKPKRLKTLVGVDCYCRIA